ncbi:MAG: Geranylgeranyl pyrophosphate synthase [Xanthomonadaceae bacterium]|nr:Geranylgeranyl pyrophosphate synthase [Xanthomonadaceae bacterium]
MPDPYGYTFAEWRVRLDIALERTLPAGVAPLRLNAAMRHAALDGGKRMRPLLVYATGTAFGCDATTLDDPAAAVELIHAYSLAHDDLPAMDDDALRRGKPTVHVAFDEATAILAGDALQALAFELLAQASFSADARVRMVRELAGAAGVRGMCGGQALDLAATGNTDRSLSFVDLEHLHMLKTGALMRASVRLGAIAANVEPDVMAQLDVFSNALGLAFQIRDDLLDVESDSATLGKTAGKDIAQAKTTFPALLGIEASRERLLQLGRTMREALLPFGPPADTLAALGRQAIERIH